MVELDLNSFDPTLFETVSEVRKDIGEEQYHGSKVGVNEEEGEKVKSWILDPALFEVVSEVGKGTDRTPMRYELTALLLGDFDLGTGNDRASERCTEQICEGINRPSKLSGRESLQTFSYEALHLENRSS